MLCVESAIAHLGRGGIGQSRAEKGDMMQKRHVGDEECRSNKYLKPEGTKKKTMKENIFFHQHTCSYLWIFRDLGRGIGFPTVYEIGIQKQFYLQC